MFERDIRLGLMDSLLSPAQANFVELVQIHRDALELDLHFYGHFAAWYHLKGQVRSFKEVFVAGLATSPLSEHRQAAQVMLAELAPHQVAGVIRLSKRHFGRCPRSLRSAVEQYLRHREAQAERFDRAALRQAKALKELYAGLHIAPGPRAQAVLFARKPPEQSLAWKVKQLSRAQSPAEQALMVLDLRLPFPIAVGCVRHLTPAVLTALVEVMTPAEVINHMKMLQNRGALEHPEVRKRIDQKLNQARKDQRVSDYRGLVAAKVVQDDQLRQRLESVTQQRLQAQGQILRSTALLVDKSSSLTEAIEVGRRVAALAAGLMKEGVPLQVLVFDTVARPIHCAGTSVAEWEYAFRGVEANGATSVGSPLAWLRAHKVAVEQFVVVTDEEENTSPYFPEQYELYQRELGVRPDITFIKVGSASEHLEVQLRRRQIGFETYRFTGDYFSLPNLIPMLTRPGRMELLMEILATPLPVKPDLAPTQLAC
jgi:hypothetical protein